MGNYTSYPDNAPKYRLDWRPDLRTNNDNRLVIHYTRYDLHADFSKQLPEKQIMPQPFDNPDTLPYHCGAAYAVAFAYTIALKCLKENEIDAEPFRSGPHSSVSTSELSKEIIKYGASTGYLYWNAREYEGITLVGKAPLDVGCSIRSCLYVLLEKGMVPEMDFPLAYYGIAKNPYWLHEKASRARKIEMFRITKDPKAIIQALQNKHPVIIGYTLHESMCDKNVTTDTEIMKYMEQDKKDERKILGGYAGVIIKYESEIRQFLVHGTPFPGRDKMFISSDTIRSPYIGDIWCIKITS